MVALPIQPHLLLERPKMLPHILEKVISLWGTIKTYLCVVKTFYTTGLIIRYLIRDQPFQTWHGCHANNFELILLTVVTLKKVFRT